MENIRIIKSQSEYFIVAELGTLLLNKEFIKEMGEPLTYDRNQFWYFAYHDDRVVGFICHNHGNILYAYTYPGLRKIGVFKALYNEIPDRPWKVNSSNMALPIYLKLGFKIIKSYKICHKLQKF